VTAYSSDEQNIGHQDKPEKGNSVKSLVLFIFNKLFFKHHTSELPKIIHTTRERTVPEEISDDVDRYDSRKFDERQF
jgi:hypothetical protein